MNKARSRPRNHYTPDYYGVEEPIVYAKWLARNNVTIWNTRIPAARRYS